MALVATTEITAGRGEWRKDCWSALGAQRRSRPGRIPGALSAAAARAAARPQKRNLRCRRASRKRMRRSAALSLVVVGSISVGVDVAATSAVLPRPPTVATGASTRAGTTDRASFDSKVGSPATGSARGPARQVEWKAPMPWTRHAKSGRGDDRGSCRSHVQRIRDLPPAAGQGQLHWPVHREETPSRLRFE